MFVSGQPCHPSSSERRQNMLSSISFLLSWPAHPARFPAALSRPFQPHAQGSYHGPGPGSKPKVSSARKSAAIVGQHQHLQQQRVVKQQSVQPGLQISLPQPGLVGHARPVAASHPPPHHAHHPINSLVLHATSSGRTPPPQARQQLPPPHQPLPGGRGSQNWGR